eukprot:scaffold108331_cov117-Phaeocystis_antarctica.AAC.2
MRRNAARSIWRAPGKVVCRSEGCIGTQSSGSRESHIKPTTIHAARALVRSIRMDRRLALPAGERQCSKEDPHSVCFEPSLVHDLATPECVAPQEWLVGLSWSVCHVRLE